MQSTIHEMRNQLAVAAANIEAFIDGKLPPTPQRLGAVLDALGKLDALMNELRPPSRTAAPPRSVMRPVDVCDLIASESVGIEASASAAGITLDVDVCARKHPECSRFECDAVQVSQVVKNVLLNAIKYTGRGGHVKLYCHREPGVIALEISDTGPGVMLEERETIFERGVRGSAATTATGSGFGLAEVRRIVDAHGGTIAVADSASGGACFVIRLPGDTRTSDDCLSCTDHRAPQRGAVAPVA